MAQEIRQPIRFREKMHQSVNSPKIPIIFINFNFFDFNFSFFGYSWSDCNSLILILLQISFLKKILFENRSQDLWPSYRLNQRTISSDLYGLTLSFTIEGSFVGCLIVQLVPPSRILFRCFLYFFLKRGFKIILMALESSISRLVGNQSELSRWQPIRARFWKLTLVNFEFYIWSVWI